MNPAMQIPTERAHGFCPNPGLSIRNFKRIAQAGFGDGHNSYAHSMAWYEGKLYVGTTRSNLCMLRLQSAYKNAPFYKWPIECPETLDELDKFDRCAQIWRYDPSIHRWELAFRSPRIKGISSAGMVAREMGYRSMAVFHGACDPKPALYAAGWAPGTAPGGHILRSYDGQTFEAVTRPGIFEQPVSATRSLTSFRDRMFFSPTARRLTERTGGQANNAGVPTVFESRDPAAQNWTEASEPGFGDSGNLGIFTLFADNDRLYAGTFNLSGFQIWASDCIGQAPYRWDKLVEKGAGRGPLNQAVASMASFNGAVYVGSGIQGGGNDRVNKVGPAGAEIIRLNPDASWDLIMGERRVVDGKRYEPLSALQAGFGNLFNGYVWTLASHNGWLYAGTFDWSVMLRWINGSEAPRKVVQFFDHLNSEFMIAHASGADLWRSKDGENWMPVTRQGFDNPYNAGIRNLVSTSYGLFVGTANFFGPRVAVRRDSEWAYEDNPRGGLEVWLGANGVAA
jgi:hypothetical protein